MWSALRGRQRAARFIAAFARFAPRAPRFVATRLKRRREAVYDHFNDARRRARKKLLNR
jgi:hypothetical protein